MITSSEYRMHLASMVYELNKAIVFHDAGRNMKVTNDRVIEVAERILVIAKEFKSQEEE